MRDAYLRAWARGEHDRRIQVDNKQCWLEPGGLVRSYDTVIAVWDHENMILDCSPHTYSITTSNHMSTVKGLIHMYTEKAKFQDSPCQPDGTLWTHPDDVNKTKQRNW